MQNKNIHGWGVENGHPKTVSCGLNRMQEILKKSIDTQRASSGGGIKAFSMSLQGVEREQWVEITGRQVLAPSEAVRGFSFLSDLGVRDPWVSLTFHSCGIWEELLYHSKLWLSYLQNGNNSYLTPGVFLRMK